MYSTTRKTAHQSTSFYLSQPKVHIRLLRKLRILTPSLPLTDRLLPQRLRRLQLLP